MSQRLRDGLSTTVSFSLNPNVTLWETSVTPPGLDGGGPNDTTSMRNSTWRTRQPKKLKTLTAFTFTAQYDPVVYDQFLAMLNVNQQITVKFPDGDKYTMWGWVNSLAPNAITEGSPPTITVGIEPSNQDNSYNEVGPVRS